MHRSGKWVGTVPGSERLWGRCALLGARLQSGPKRLFLGTLGSDVVSFSIPSLLLCVKDVVLSNVSHNELSFVCVVLTSYVLIILYLSATVKGKL